MVYKVNVPSNTSNILVTNLETIGLSSSNYILLIIPLQISNRQGVA